MAYKHVELDLRLKFYRRKRDYWRGVREGRIPWPKYKKPRLFRIKLDPEQALLAQCMVGNQGWYTAGDHFCKHFMFAGAGRWCDTAVRALSRGNFPTQAEEFAQPS